MSTYLGTIVLCGGTSARMCVPDKTALPFGTATLLDSALLGLPSGPVVCVGPPRPLLRDGVTWTRETPPGGGPLDGIRAGLNQLTNMAAPPEYDAGILAVIAGDQPFAGRAVPHLLKALEAAAATTHAVAASTDSNDLSARPALLLAAYRVHALAHAVRGDTRNQGVYRALKDLHVKTVPLPLEHISAALDVDTPEDLDLAQQHINRTRTN
ncbi:molybdenum cofactor guanylyltransferase [Dermatophilus congolensis]|uniref:Molybdopterin-guanine dinucleotide biosynthesis protein MobA n=1 Tax=Dermatophilus congolensis TaxID=1863 RepID=A0A239V6L6_9MICO|nr:NTP transferase domain-containing protein [Dermatophilus congolensis]MBO3130180.1 NTP transferase domain-containing protein [Dermatophilus congolensis]MBO3131193.1 NTP transferase domain-containing protein [Dermatophilus congolensis]MBO3134651.1 NTP transferase domain-containing protein [Dermatophilus congolensis]MBO3136888.1 NTP transferase domain-containing protein [Dermatophilus congolensis]MBO3139132.1 NTP transferase domain-containing protein [Dermatophilus congolensis]